MASGDLIPVYIEGDVVGIARPAESLTRRELRGLKKEGKGYFVSNGKAFVRRREVQHIEGQDFIRDTPITAGESASIQPPTMNDYADGVRRARAAIDGWRPMATIVTEQAIIGRGVIRR